MDADMSVIHLVVVGASNALLMPIGQAGAASLVTISALVVAVRVDTIGAIWTDSFGSLCWHSIMRQLTLVDVDAKSRVWFTRIAGSTLGAIGRCGPITTI